MLDAYMSVVLSLYAVSIETCREIRSRFVKNETSLDFLRRNAPVNHARDSPFTFFQLFLRVPLLQLNGIGQRVTALHSREVSIGDLSAEVGQQQSRADSRTFSCAW